MKKLFLFVGLLVLIGTEVITLNSCKKGSEDPFISLRSRTARLVGKWKLSAGNDTSITNGTPYYTEYTSTSMIDKYNGGSSTNLYEETMTFNRDGSYVTYKKTNVGSDTSYNEITVKGVWDFNSGIGDEVKKEKVILTPKNIEQKYTDGATVTMVNYAYPTNNFYIQTYELVRLSNKELKICLLSNYDQNGGGTLGSSGKYASHKTYSVVK